MVTLAAIRISDPTQRLYKMLNSKKGTGEMQYVQSYHNDITSGRLYFFLPLFLILTSFYLLIVVMEGYCCTSSHSVIHKHIHTHTHTLGRIPLD